MSKLYTTFFKDARAIILKSPYFINPFKKDNSLEIEAFIIDNKEQIEKGNKIHIVVQNGIEKEYPTYYIANMLYADKRIAFLNEFEINDTTLFILPLLETRLDYKVLTLPTYFINAYVQHNKHFNDIGDCLYLVYRYMPFNNYHRLMEILSGLNNFITVEKSQDGRFDLVKFDIPKQNKEHVQAIIKGKYFELPKNIKSKIINFSNKKEDDLVSQVLLKGKELQTALAIELDIRTSDLPDNLREKPNLKLEQWIEN